MKLKGLREHYKTPNGGLDWVPKKEFKSLEDIKEQGFSEEQWTPYRCRVCNAIHLTTNRD